MLNKGGSMTYILAVFRSRNETLYFANMLRQAGCASMIINTPKEAGQACGISVRFNDRVLPIAQKCLSLKPFRAFVGFYKIVYEKNKLIFERIS